MRGSYCLVIVTVLITVLKSATSVKVVVIRENSSSRSMEESEEKSSSEESEEIDFILDLIRKKESSEQKSQPATKTFKIIRKQQSKQKPSSKEITSESNIHKASVPKEDPKKPKEHKEYHVHYHSHQHQLPEEPSLKLDEDKIRPVYWDLGSSNMDDYQPYVKKSKKMTMLLPFSDNEKFDGFKDYSSLLDTKLIPSSSDEYVIGDISSDHLKDFSSTFESELLAKKLESDRNRKLIKKYQTLLKSAGTVRPKINYSQKDYSASYETSQPAKVPTRKPQQLVKLNKPRLQKERFPNNRDRFAGFTDFSSIESPQPKDTNPVTQQSSKAEEGLISKDFGYFVKDKPRQTFAPLPKMRNFRKNAQQVRHRHGVFIPPAKASPSQNMQQYKKRLPKVPRVLTAPGGIPLQVERLNQFKANPKSTNLSLQYLNALETGSRLLHVQPLNRPDSFFSRLYNGWYLQRIQR